MPDIIQKATDYDKQSAKFKKVRPFDTLRQTHLLQPKYDGCHLLINTTERRAFSRTNEDVRSVQHLIDSMCKAMGPGWVVQGEAWIEGEAFPTISGLYRQHKPAPELDFVAYDALPDTAFPTGLWTEFYTDRHHRLQSRLYGAPSIMVADTMSARDRDPLAFANQLVALGGYDGAILRDPIAFWRAGPSRMGELVKVKPTVSLDLVVTNIGTDVGAKTGRPVYVLAVEYRGVQTLVGSGVPHDGRDLPKIGNIVEVECMAVNPNNTLREPRFKGIKHDKLYPDT